MEQGVYLSWESTVYPDGGAYEGLMKDGQCHGPSEVYDLFPQMIVNLSVFSIFFCWFLYFKGKYAPSSSDSGSGGNLLMDYFWGMELYPRLFWGSLDVKTFTNCRFGMMGWAVLIVTFALTQHERNPAGVTDAMLVCVTLMMAYVAKFFLWETGYWGSMDIMHDRAGYMIWPTSH